MLMPIKGWDVIFFYFLDEKSPARVAKVPTAILNPAKLLITDSSWPPNLQDVPQALVDEHLQLLLQSLGQPPGFRTIQEHCTLHLTQRFSTGSWLFVP